MRQVLSFLSLSLAIIPRTRALDASIFTFSPSPWQNSKAPLINDDAAQHLLELRMNLPTASALGGWDQDTVDLLDRYGGAPSSLFGYDVDRKVITRNLIIFEGIDIGAGGSSVQENYQGDLMVTSLSADFLNDLLLRLSSETKFNGSIVATEKYCKFDSEVEINPNILQSLETCMPKGSAFEALTHMFRKELLGLVKVAETWVDEQSLTAVLRISFQSPNELMNSGFAADFLTPILRGLRTLSSEGEQVTAVLLAQSSKVQGLKRRVNRRGAVEEEALSKSTSATVMATLQKQEFPVCFTSNSSCDAATSSCSGHGFCYKKSGAANDEAASDCYACKCKSTIIAKEDGTVQKVRWGGPACQKRDISSPFFLIAGISILVVMATGTAVGMLFHIGQDELPGVISAGVGPARAQK